MRLHLLYRFVQLNLVWSLFFRNFSCLRQVCSIFIYSVSIIVREPSLVTALLFLYNLALILLWLFKVRRNGLAFGFIPDLINKPLQLRLIVLLMRLVLNFHVKILQILVLVQIKVHVILKALVILIALVILKAAIVMFPVGFSVFLGRWSRLAVGCFFGGLFRFNVTNFLLGHFYNIYY